MTREIKFRAWNGVKMEYNVMAGWLGAFYVKGIDENDTACMSPFNTNLGNSPLMQYSGLKDKNGKEIYEGDIVVIRPIDPDMLSDMRIVEYNNQDASFELVKKDKEPHWFNHEISTFEIIGNIYENPELLK